MNCLAMVVAMQAQVRTMRCKKEYAEGMADLYLVHRGVSAAWVHGRLPERAFVLF